MKKMKLFLLAGAMVAGMFATVGAQAHCGNDSGNNAHDPFGSCENTGNVECATDATDAQLFTAKVVTAGGAGAQVCNEGGTLPLPVGRAGVYRADSGKVTAHVDGDADMVGSKGTTRIDIDPASANCKVRVRRGEGGSYWTTGGNMQDAGVADECESTIP